MSFSVKSGGKPKTKQQLVIGGKSNNAPIRDLRTIPKKSSPIKPRKPRLCKDENGRWLIK